MLDARRVYGRISTNKHVRAPMPEKEVFMKKFVCTVCGYVYHGEQPPEKCPICNVPADKFKEVPEDEEK